MIKKLFVVVLSTLGLSAPVYLAFSFGALTTDVSEWPELARFAFGLWFIIMLGTTARIVGDR